jgi:hypothetical protein
MHALRLVSFLISLFFLSLSSIFSQTPPQVEFFSPQNTVKNIRQVAVRFSEAMVPFGSPRMESQVFDIDCSEKGSARWADERNFERDLPAGVRCEFSVKAGLKSLAGREITGQRRFVFFTGGPAIRQAYPFEGNTSIDEEQIFILQLDAEAAEDSVLASVNFAVEGLVERIGVRLVAGRERDTLLKVRYPRGVPAATPVIFCRRASAFPPMPRSAWSRAKACARKAASPPKPSKCCHSRAAPPSPRHFAARARTRKPAACRSFLSM